MNQELTTTGRIIPPFCCFYCPHAASCFSPSGTRLIAALEEAEALDSLGQVGALGELEEEVVEDMLEEVEAWIQQRPLSHPY